MSTPHLPAIFNNSILIHLRNISYLIVFLLAHPVCIFNDFGLEVANNKIKLNNILREFCVNSCLPITCPMNV